VGKTKLAFCRFFDRTLNIYSNILFFFILIWFNKNSDVAEKLRDTVYLYIIIFEDFNLFNAPELSVIPSEFQYNENTVMWLPWYMVIYWHVQPFWHSVDLCDRWTNRIAVIIATRRAAKEPSETHWGWLPSNTDTCYCDLMIRKLSLIN